MNIGPHDTFVARRIEISPWRLWFAWYPVRTTTGERVWGRKIYRRCINTYVDYDDWRHYEYADMFDVLGNE